MRRIVFIHRERRQTGSRVEWVALFEVIGSPMCYDANCLSDGPHRHQYDVSDLSAEELLGLDPRSWREAFEDLNRQDPRRFPTMAAAVRELRREADEDEDAGKAMADCGRRVA